MIHARVDTPDHKKIVSFKTGTRETFDSEHAGDHRWIFLDSYRVKYRADFTYFLRYPWKYIIDNNGDVHLSDELPLVVVDEMPTLPADFYYTTTEDGGYIRNEDGTYQILYLPGYTDPPNGDLYLTDPNFTFLTDGDDEFLIEPATPTDDLNTYVMDVDGKLITDGDDGPLITDNE